MSLKALIKSDPQYTVSALVKIKPDQNDKPLLSSLKKRFELTGNLSPPQIKALQKLLPKYHGQVPGLKPIKNVQEEVLKIKKNTNTRTVGMLDQKMIVNFEFNQIDVVRMNTIPGREFVRHKGHWECPLSFDNYDLLNSWGYHMDLEIRKWRRSILATLTNMKLPKLDFSGLPGVLREYQEVGVRYLEAKNGRAILGDEMGLGKTVQALVWAWLHPERRPLVVVTTGTSKLNWEKESAIWLPKESVYICYGESPSKADYKQLKKHKVIIINYNILSGRKKGRKTWTSYILKLNPPIVLTDECHYYKNNGRKRTKAVKRLAKKAPHFIPMSGTPLENGRPIELFNALNLTSPALFPDYWAFAKEFCDAQEDNFGHWDCTGASNLKTLHSKLQSVMVRRLKSEVLTDLPPKIRTVIPLPHDPHEYKKALKGFEEWCRGTYTTKDKEVKSNSENPAAAMVEMEKIKQAAAKGKMESVLSWIDDYLATEAKIVIFCEHRDIQEMLLKHYKGQVVSIVGGTSAKDKEKAVEEFQACRRCGVRHDKHTTDKKACKRYWPNKKVRVMVCSKAGKEALTLTAAKATCTIEFWWNPASHDQAEDRVHRYGQDADSVLAYYLIAKGTIEEDIFALLDHKRTVNKQTLDGVKPEESEMLMALLTKYTKREYNKSRKFYGRK